MKLTPLIHAHTQTEIDAAFQRFLALENTEKSALLIMSVVYRPIGITKFDLLIKYLIARGFLHGSPQQYAFSSARKAELDKLSLMQNTREGMRVHPLLANTLTLNLSLLGNWGEGAGDQSLVVVLHAIEQIMPNFGGFAGGRSSWANTPNYPDRFIRDLYFLAEIDNLEAQLTFSKDPWQFDLEQSRILVELLFLPYELKAFKLFSSRARHLAFISLINLCQLEGSDIGPAVLLLEKACEHFPDDALLKAFLAEQYLCMNRLQACNALISQPALIESKQDYYPLQLDAVQAFLKGELEYSLNQFDAALAAKNKLVRRKKPFLGGIAGVIHKLALIIYANQHDAAYFEIAVTQLDNQDSPRKQRDEFTNLAYDLAQINRCLSKNVKYKPYRFEYGDSNHFESLTECLQFIIYMLGALWCNGRPLDKTLNGGRERCIACIDALERMGQRLFAEWARQCLAYSDNNLIDETQSLIDLPSQIKVKEDWEYALEKLAALKPKQVSEVVSESSAPTQRLIWELHLERFQHKLVPREQKRTQTGWSKGRTVSLKRLREDFESLDYLSEQDKRICQAIGVYQSYGYYNRLEYALEGLEALAAAVGAENVFLPEDLVHPIEIIAKEPELMVSEQGDKLCISLAGVSQDFSDEDMHYPADVTPYSLNVMGSGQYALVTLNPEHFQVARILGEGLLVPQQAKSKALKSIAAIAPLLNIQSDVAELETGLKTIEPELVLYVTVQPIQRSSGLQFICQIMPFGEQGPAFKPGVGNASVTAMVDDKRLATTRDLVAEQMLLDELDATCPNFLAMADNVLYQDELQDALATLEQLEVAVQTQAMDLALRWPKGKKYTLTSPLTSENMQLAVAKKRNEWFSLSGEIQVDEHEVVDFRKLLNLIGQTNGRYVRLDGDKILALSDDLRRQLTLLNQVTDEGEFHPLASLQVEEATSGMRMKTLHAWEAQTQKMHQANTIEPVIPSTLQAELRDYQTTGFDWAMRLAHWGAGACLADDMGLGKTLQALTVLLARASQGPSLVIAPTSVCFNWRREAQIFAPLLNIKMYAELSTTAERKTLLADVEAFDCVVISYGLLQREIELLKEINWNTVVADEAQALKNPLAKRTKAAYALNADFKMITTGTPIENDLTELWSLFRFINPGLLGNLKRFTQRFIQPMEKAKDDKLAARKASQSLRALTQPFILRRLKSQVLTELPARTEIVHTVELGTQERAFYEAVRRNAVEVISNVENTASTGEQRIKMLAELVKLRQACCHPKLIMPDADPDTLLSSAKLDALDELLTELLANHHKALVFSQFVGHLSIIKAHLEQRGIAYQYLDGSTPQKIRDQRVNAFQKGEGDVFLISLKAGGVGLNLTAADYVIHMDPWWNPAVEDQASDRAHRIGQRRPVTIYRIVAKDTIEERIISLHQHKRDLADKLLSGTDQAKSLSVNDMLVLLKETF